MARSSLPACPVCTEGLGLYGGPTTLPCGHNACLSCAAYLQQRDPRCPLCRTAFPPDLQLAVNCELRELMRMAAALTTVEAEEEGWAAVATTARVDMAGCKAGGAPGSPRGCTAPLPGGRVSVGQVLDGAVGSAMELDPTPWEPDSSSAACRSPGCGRPFAFLLRPRHHCRCCGRLFCGSCCSERLLLPPKFRCDEPQRVCAACAEVLLPVQPLLAGSISPAVKQPVHDVFDLSAPRSLLNPPLAGSLEAAIYSATNIVRAHAASVGGLGPERQIPPAILRGCAGLAVLSVARVGLGWSVAAGSGLVVARRPPGGGDGGPGWSAPSAVLSLASSVGWQLGAEVQDLVLVLRDEAALRAFTGSQLGLGGAASVAAGPVGRAAAASARAALGGAGLAYSYGATRGAYAGVALEGTALFPRDAVNQRFYGRKVTARQLLVSGAVAPPPAAGALYAALDALMAHAAGEGSPRAAAADPQFLQRASSEPGLHPPPAVGVATAGAAGAAGNSEDEWEPEEGEEPPSAPAYGHSQAGRGRLSVADVAGAAHPWHASAPAFEEEAQPQSWGFPLFD